MKNLLRLFRTALALGPGNILRVVIYRLPLRLGCSAVQRLRAHAPSGSFFRACSPAERALPPPSQAWREHALWFGRHIVPLSRTAPDWYCNPLRGTRVADVERPWWKIPDFDPAVGDIKTVWEASRFDWVLAFAQRARTGDEAELRRLQDWLSDWCRHNAPYHGPNWKCGQEASIRVMHLATAALLLGQHEAPEPALLDLVELHLQRIVPTMSYAVAQENNHGTSEAAALFIGGSWLARCRPGSDGARWADAGRHWLENRVQRLVAVDGSFSQYSLTYHRLMLDTLSLAEIWRRHTELPAFSPALLERARAAANWLHLMLRPGGDAPNLGANDGAHLLPLTDTGYRDFRPSVQTAMILFAEARALAEPGPWDWPLQWLGLSLPDTIVPAPRSRCLDDGGYACMVQGRAFVLVRYPRFRFRPGQADALHLDFWLGTENVLRDAGSFSYNTDEPWQSYFPGTAAHNTVQFDGRDQMPRLGRFLFADWLRTESAPQWQSGPEEDQIFAVAYRDATGARHGRRAELAPGRLLVCDDVSGFAHQAILRWRLAPGNWTLSGNTAGNGHLELTVSADVALQAVRLAEGWESQYYLQRSPLPVLEVVLRHPGRITTCIEWTP